MAEEKKEKWLSYLALTTVILAVAATLSTFRAGNFSTRTVLNEIKASNQWSYFQAKKIRAYMFDVQKENLESDLEEGKASLAPEAVEKLQKRIGKYGEKIKGWDEETKDIFQKARSHEAERDMAMKYSQAFGYAVIFLQMGILLSSIAALMKRKVLWVVGLIIGAVGLVYFANGFLLFM